MTVQTLTNKICTYIPVCMLGDSFKFVLTTLEKNIKYKVTIEKQGDSKSLHIHTHIMSVGTFVSLP